MDSLSQGPRNALAKSRSPYLLQHADNPVDWREWGNEAFESARERDVPIFLSIGYSTCHWCHVMAHESFENEAIAARMNAGFVNIKVDREERPDVDRIYMAFVQSMTGSGGWPMSVWLTPELKPFYGGTYFPPDNRQGRVGFPHLLERIAGLWRNRRGELVEQGSRFSDTIGKISAGQAGESGEFDWEAPNRCLEELVREFDEQWGGFGNAPKFPMPSYFAFLLEMVDAYGADVGKRALIGNTLDRMADGGIRDFLAGGFHRYSVDRYWHVPHFEKMLYDQGQLAGVFSDSARLLERMDDLATGQEIVDYVREQLREEAGGLYSAEDADSPLPDQPDKSGEGAFYVWKAEELKAQLGEGTYAIVRDYFGVRDEGNVKSESDPHGDFTGLNVLMRRGSIERIAKDHALEPDRVDRSLREALEKLKAVRSLRPRPHLDDKILASWNGLMISGACKVYQGGGGDASLALARDAGTFIAERLFDDSTNTLYRTFRIERGDTVAFAEDYASAALAFIDLYESTGDALWLRRSERFLDILVDRFWDEANGGFFASPEGDASLIARLKDDTDGAEPSANSLAALALIKLGAISGDDRFVEIARKTIQAFRYQWAAAPRSMPLMLVAMMRMLRPIQQIVIVADGDAETSESMRQAAFHDRKLHSALIFIDGQSDWLLSRNPRLAEFANSSSRATAYVCEDYTCKVPATDAEALSKQLSGK